MKAEDFSEEMLDLAGTKVRLTTYKIGEDFYCHVYSADPGATIARASSRHKETAREVALEKARARLSKTRSLY